MGGFMLRVDCGRWGQTPDDLRRVGPDAPRAHPRARARPLRHGSRKLCHPGGGTHRAPSADRDGVVACLSRPGPRGPGLWPHRRPSPLCARTAASLGEVVRAAQDAAAAPPVDGADPAPRFTLKRLVAFVRERFGLSVCRETIRAVLHRLALSWKKAKKLLGRADPEQRRAFIDRLQDLLAGAQRDRHLLVYLDEAHLHQDTDLGYGWCARGERLWVASSSPGLSAKVSFISTTRARFGCGPMPAPMERTRSRCCAGCGLRCPTAQSFCCGMEHPTIALRRFERRPPI